MPTPTELADAYLKGAADLRTAVADMTPAQLTARPIPGRWSALEVVAHLADFEPVLADRILRVIAMPKPLLMGADETLFASATDYHARNVAEELALIDAIRTKMARVIRGLRPDALAGAGVHSERGLLTLEQVIRTAVNHIPHHLTFLAEKRTALGI